MDRTRFSLFYVATYINVAGIMLLFFPSLAFKLMFSNGDYGTVIPRLAGTLLIGLGIFIIEMIRLRLYQLYATTLLIRAFFLTSYGVFYFNTHDPFFICMIGVVGFGFLMTGTCYILDQRQNTGI